MSAKFTKNAPGYLVPTSMRQVRVLRGRLDERQLSLRAFVPAPLPPSLDRTAFLGTITQELLDATSAVCRLDGLAQTLADPHLLLYPLMLREAKLSSRIENTIASIEEVSLFDLTRATQREEAREVRNYVAAMRLGVDSDLPICKRLMLEMHAKLLEGVRGDDKGPGQFRNGQVVVGDVNRSAEDARFVPPPAGPILMECLDLFEKFVNDVSHKLPPLVAIALAHYQFESIHPFRDGNGRIGRAVAALSLCKGPDPLMRRPFVYVSGFFDRFRTEYYDLLLRVSTHGDWTSWVRFFLSAVASEARDSSSRVRRVLDLRESYRARITRRRASVLLHRLIDHLFTNPMLTTRRAADLLGIAPQAAQRHIQELLDKGVLEETTGSNYGRIWAARELLRIIDDESTTDPEK